MPHPKWTFILCMVAFITVMSLAIRYYYGFTLHFLQYVDNMTAIKSAYLPDAGATPKNSSERATNATHVFNHCLSTLDEWDHRELQAKIIFSMGTPVFGYLIYYTLFAPEVGTGMMITIYCSLPRPQHLTSDKLRYAKEELLREARSMLDLIKSIDRMLHDERIFGSFLTAVRRT